MSTRFAFGKTVLRLFDSKADATDFGNRFRGESWTPVEFACGWLLRGAVGNFHDAAGPIPWVVSEEIAEALLSATEH